MLLVHKTMRKTEIADTVMRTVPKESSYFDAVRAILGELKQEYALDDYAVITALPQELVLTRTFSFPFSGNDVLREIVLQEISESLPLSIDEMRWNIKVSPQKNKNSEVLFAAAGKSAASLYLDCFADNEMKPVFIGIESEAIYDALRYTKTDSVINYVHCDIGHNKTILTIVQNGIHTASETIAIGTSELSRYVAKIMKIDEQSADAKLELLHLDIESVEANMNTGFYKSLKLSKKQMELIYTKSVEIMETIANHVKSTIRIIHDDNPSADFERLFLSGGAASIRNIADLFYKISSLPVAACEILSNTNNRQIQNRFYTSLGLFHSYHDRKERINLADEAKEEGQVSPLIQYYPAMVFAASAVITLLIALLLSFVFTGRQHSRNHDLLAQQFTKLYRVKIEKDKDPVSEAKALLQKEIKRREALEVIAPHDKTSIQTISEITEAFPEGEGFILASLTLSESTITVNGTSPDTQLLESFKNNLNSSGNFDSVTLNTNISSRSGTSFTMTIKTKNSEAKKNQQTSDEKADN